MSAVTAFLERTGHDFGKEEKRPRWWLYNERSRRGWYSDTPLKTDDRGDALKLPPTTLDNISRFLGFWDKGALIILTHGFMKKSQKTPDQEIRKALEYRADREGRS
jgi:hypothetical protein